MCFRVVVLTGENPLWEEKRLCKNLYRILIFPRENWLYSQLSGQKFYYKAIFVRGKFYFGKKSLSFFRGENLLGDKITP